MSNSKRAKYSCKYKAEWAREFTFIQPVAADNTSVCCSWCKSNFSVSAGGKNDISRHCQSAKHKSHKKMLSSAD